MARDILDFLYLLSRLNKEEEARDAWKLMSLNETKASIPEKSLLMFICSVLSFEKEFI